MSSLAIVTIFKRSAQRFLAKDTFEMGGALAYYTVFSLTPLVLIAIVIAGVMFEREVARGQIAHELEIVFGPEVSEAVANTLGSARVSQSSTTASIIGVVVLLFGASGVFVQLENSLNKIWEVPVKAGGGVWRFARRRLLSFAMVLGIGLLLLTSLIVSVVLAAMSRYVAPGQTFAYDALNEAVSFAITTLLFALIFKALPACRVEWKDVWLGASLTSFLFLFGKYLIGLYLSNTGVATAYGAAGSLVVILLWVFYASQILLFGAQFTQVVATYRNGE
jgi:membrane protein